MWSCDYVVAFALQLHCTQVYETPKTSKYTTRRPLGTIMNFTDSELVYSKSFEMNQQQTYRGPVFLDVGWMRGTLVYNNSLSPICSPPPQKKLPVEPKGHLQLDYIAQVRVTCILQRYLKRYLARYLHLKDPSPKHGTFNLALSRTSITHPTSKAMISA